MSRNCEYNHYHHSGPSGQGVVVLPCSPKCGATNPANFIRTVRISANNGTDEAGQPYAPQTGAYINTIVEYLANGAVYFYDSQGVFTQMNQPVVPNT